MRISETRGERNNTVNTLTETTKRNEGIDLLRIVSMFFVMMLHTLGQGGVLYAGTDVANVRVAWALEIIAFGAVDIFAMISGYVGYSEKKKPFRVSKYVMTWLMVFTYSVVLIFVQNALIEGSVNGATITLSFFPVTSSLYWYFTAYTGLFVLMPLLDVAVRTLSEDKLKKVLFVLLIVFSGFDFWADKFIPGNGYSMTWLVVLYLIGAIIKKCDIGANIKSKSLVLIIVLCAFFTWVWKMNAPGFTFLNIGISGNTMVDYVSPTMVISSMAYVILFSRIRVKKGGDLQKFIRFCAPAVFAAYIINCHTFIWWYFLAGRFAFLAQRSVLEIIGVVVGFSALFLGAAVLIERGRMALVEVLRIKKGVEWLEDKIRGVIFRPKKENLYKSVDGSDKWEL